MAPGVGGQMDLKPVGNPAATGNMTIIGANDRFVCRQESFGDSPGQDRSLEPQN